MYCCDDCKLSHTAIHSRECQQICLYDLDEMARLSLRLVWSLANTHTPSGSSSVIVTRGNERMPGCDLDGVYSG